MSDYAQQRLAEIREQNGAPLPAPRARRRRAPVPSPLIEMRKPEHVAAHKYIRKARSLVGAPEIPNWFDVHDAFVAGWIAAQGAKP